jgi:hypothetical protein
MSAVTFQDIMGALAVLIALAAYAIYIWQSFRGETRPHPLSWLIFGILTGTWCSSTKRPGRAAGSWRSPRWSA